MDLYHKADSILIPVMPSIIDLQAMELFLGELGRLLKQRPTSKTYVGVIANRVRMKGRSYHNRRVDGGWSSVGVGSKDTQNYSIAMESGLGICELKPGISAKDKNTGIHS